MLNAARSALSTIVIALLGCAPAASLADTKSTANSVFVQAVQDWHVAEELAGNDTASVRRRVEKIREVNEALGKIISEHSTSDLAVKLVIGEKIGPLSIPEMKEAGRKAELKLHLAECAESPSLGCIIDHAKMLGGEGDNRLPSFYFRNIAEVQAKAGLYKESLETADGIEDQREREEALAAVSARMAEAGDIEEAIDIALGIQNPTHASRAIKAIVLALIDDADFQSAQKFLDRMEDEAERLSAMKAYSRALAKAGQLSASLELIEMFGVIDRSSVMADIVEDQVNVGKYQMAWDVATNIPRLSYYCEAVTRVAFAAGDQELIQAIEKLVRGIEEKFDRMNCLSTFGIQANLPSVLAEARTLAADSGGYSIWIMMKGELDAGLIDEAYRTALLEVEDSRSDRLLSVALNALEAGRLDLVKRILPSLDPSDEARLRGSLWSKDGQEFHIERMWRIANEIEDGILSGQSAVGSFVSAVDNLDRLDDAADIARKVPNKALREGNLSWIALEYAKAGNFREAIVLLMEVEKRGALVDGLVDVAGEMTSQER